LRAHKRFTICELGKEKEKRNSSASLGYPLSVFNKNSTLKERALAIKIAAVIRLEAVDNQECDQEHGRKRRTGGGLGLENRDRGIILEATRNSYRAVVM